MRQRSSISCRGARRLLRGVPSADPREQQVAAVLAVLAPQDGAQAEVPEEVLRAFAQQAPAGGADREQHTGARVLRISRSAVLKAAVAVLALSSGTVAAAAADVLPGPAQRAAHSLFGDWGVPEPKPTKSPSAPSLPLPTSAVGTGAGSAQPSASLVPTASPSPSSACSDTNTRAANAHCPTGAATAAGNGHATQTSTPTPTPGHGHTQPPTPHGSTGR